MEGEGADQLIWLYLGDKWSEVAANEKKQLEAATCKDLAHG